MIRCVLIISLLVVCYSCKETIPSGIIKPGKMQEVLWDVFKADALSQQFIIKDSSKSLSEERLLLTKKVFLIHNITEAQFEKSYAYYTHHPDIMRNMLDSINAQQTRLSSQDTLLKHKRMKIDSIKQNNSK